MNFFQEIEGKIRERKEIVKLAKERPKEKEVYEKISEKQKKLKEMIEKGKLDLEYLNEI